MSRSLLPDHPAPPLSFAVEHDLRFGERLLRQFDRNVRRVRGWLNERCGEQFADELVRETRRELTGIIPRIPYIGDDNPLRSTLTMAAIWLALWRVLSPRGYSFKDAGALFYEIVDVWYDTFPRALLRVVGRIFFSRLFRRELRKEASLSHQHAHAGDFEFDVVEASSGDEASSDDFDFGVDYTHCAVVDFLRREGAETIAPAMCRLDFSMSRALGLGLRRTGTLAENEPRCDFRFKRHLPAA